MPTVKYSPDGKPGRADWKKVEALTDAQIDAAIDADPDAAPRLGDEWFRSAVLREPVAKTPISLRVDGDVTAWFRDQGRGWQTRMNAVLRAYAKAHGGVK